jgi:hypothetical protein
MLSLRMSRAIPLLPLCAFFVFTEKTLPFTTARCLDNVGFFFKIEELVLMQIMMTIVPHS